MLSFMWMRGHLQGRLHIFTSSGDFEVRLSSVPHASGLGARFSPRTKDKVF